MEKEFRLPHVLKNSRLVVARVSLLKRVTIPPNSVVRLSWKMNTMMQGNYFIEPVDQLKFLIPRTVCAAETEPTVCTVNPTDLFQTLKKGEVIEMLMKWSTLNKRTFSQILLVVRKD